ncbi:hypothetical protein HY745_01085 [Candidatus Desantisbacteria bacterium]|nr:hypothetical protein [Candidatus Desantisbacteria bacterium]
MKTYFKYEYFKKDYNVLAIDHNGFYILNGYQYEIQNNRDKKSSLDFDIMQKNVKYDKKTEDDYTKTAANIKFNYDRKKNWKTSVGLENNFYKYNNRNNDKKRYYANLSGEKILLNGDLTISIDLKYRVTDNEQKPDNEQKAVRFGAEYKW